MQWGSLADKEAGLADVAAFIVSKYRLDPKSINHLRTKSE
jgi:hypothetical protein